MKLKKKTIKNSRPNTLQPKEWGFNLIQ
jgi:hypothetical protein